MRFPTHPPECNEPDRNFNDHTSVDDDFQNVECHSGATVRYTQRDCRYGEGSHGEVKNYVHS